MSWDRQSKTCYEQVNAYYNIKNNNLKVPQSLGNFKGINSLLLINNDVYIAPMLETWVDVGNDGELSPIHVL